MHEMMTLASLKDRYECVKQRIADAAARAGRTPNQVMLVAVTKTAEPDQIRDLIRMGHVDFAENRVQQLLQRAAIIDEWMARHKTVSSVPWDRPSTVEIGGDERAGESTGASGAGGPGAGPGAGPGSGPGLGTRGPMVRWHMIGHLQRNKAKKVIETCRLIHSVDTLRLAEEVQAVAVKREQPVDVLLQVNCSEEPQKYGCAIPATIHLAEQIETMLNVRLRGLMTMAAYGDGAEGQDTARRAFVRCRELFDEIRDSGAVSPHFNILSMGMSGDFEIGIEEGSNLVRVGTAIFGAGNPETDQSLDGSIADDGEDE